MNIQVTVSENQHVSDSTHCVSSAFSGVVLEMNFIQPEEDIPPKNHNGFVDRSGTSDLSSHVIHVWYLLYEKGEGGMGCIISHFR